MTSICACGAVLKKIKHSASALRFVAGIIAQSVSTPIIMLNVSQFFPVSLPCMWQHSGFEHLDIHLKNWLLDPNSLTARLKANATNFKVVVVGQAQARCSEQESCQFIAEGEPVLIREVLLYCDDSPQVFARSLLPLSSLTGDEASLASLGEMPLGQVIFNNPNLVRGDISVGCFDANSKVAEVAQFLDLPKQEQLWGRRSLFFLHDKPLSVAEVFLPGAFAYQQEDVA